MRISSGKTRILWGAVVVALLGGVALLLWPKAEARPNVLIVLWDTVRADRMSLYGHARPTTPFLQSLAPDALVYDDAIATSEWTGPTHASLFTGLPLQTHGMDTHYKWLDGHHLTLAEHLGDQGYDTWAFTGNRFVSGFVNLLQGFRVQDHTFKGRYKRASAKATRDKLIRRDRSTEISPAWTPDGHGEGWSKKLTLYKDAAPVSLRAFAHFLDEERDPNVPFFGFINLMEAHQPRIPSLASRKALMDDATLERGLITDSSLFSLMSFMHGKRSFTDEELAAMAATYDASLLDLDKAAARLFRGLEERGLRENTVVVFTSDHGEMLGEKGLYSHRWALYQPLLHVPLMITGPGVKPDRVQGPVTTAGLFATLCELTGSPVPTGVAAPLAPGQPVFAELRDPNAAMPSILAAYAELDMTRFRRKLSAVIDGADKLIRANDHSHELYDLSHDPAELHPLSDPSKSARMLDTLSAWEARTPDYDPARRAPDDNSKQLADPETQRLLEVLGYTDD